MNDVERFIKHWEDSKGPEDFLEKSAGLPDPKSIHAAFENLDPNEREKIEGKLKVIMDALAEYAEQMQSKMAETHQQIKDSQASAEACASYEQAGKSKKNKES